MRQGHLKQFIYLFIFVGIVVFFPVSVSADNILKQCYYMSDDAAHMYKLTVYDDYSISGIITRFSASSMNKSKKLENWDKDVVREWGNNVCPKYVVLYRVSGGLKHVFHSPWVYKATATNSAESANELISKVRDITEWYRQAEGYRTELYKSIDSDGNVVRHDSSKKDPNEKKKVVISKCEHVLGDPTNSKSVAWFLQKLFNYVKVLGPILVIIMSALDFTKTIMNSDDEAMKKAQKRLGIRLMCAIGIYFLPMIITLMINLVFGTANADAICGIK